MTRKLGKREVPEKIHVFVATPAYDGKVDTDFCQSLAEAAFVSPLYQVKMTSCVMGNGAFIDLARNIFVKMFLENEEYADCTHLFFIDADLKFEPRAFIGLVKSGLPICAGVYRRRQEPEDYPVKWQPHPEMGGLWIEDDGWLMCNRVPTGFLCISRKVLEEMAADAEKMVIHGQEGTVPKLFYTKLDDQKRFVGEDFTFCDDYIARYGKFIPVWTDFDFRHGGYECNFHKYLVAEVEKQQEADATSDAA